MTRAVTKKQPQQLQDKKMLDAIAGTAGLEEADSASFAIPFLKLLQKMSPEVDADAPEFVAGAKPGQFYVPTSDLLVDIIRVIPVHFRRVFIEWKTREDGGGFIAEYAADVGVPMLAECTKDDKNRDILPNGHELQDTRVHYLMAFLQDGSLAPVVLSAARTQIKGSKEWLSRISARKLPDGRPVVSFAQVYDLATVKKSNDQGSWHVFRASPVGLITELTEPQSLLDAAKNFRSLILDGAATVAFEEDAPVADTTQAF